MFRVDVRECVVNIEVYLEGIDVRDVVSLQVVPMLCYLDSLSCSRSVNLHS